MSPKIGQMYRLLFILFHTESISLTCGHHQNSPAQQESEFALSDANNKDE